MDVFQDSMLSSDLLSSSEDDEELLVECGLGLMTWMTWDDGVALPRFFQGGVKQHMKSRRNTMGKPRRL